ncbi:MAG: isoleucine--tRNA ligase [Candidatus Pacearchaeota archaeon]
MTNLKENEEKILDFWKKNRIYEKSVKKNSKGKKFYFMDGPPYATGHIHMGTALNKILKDIVMRSQRLQGKNVFDRPGYDTHGLPIEFQVEKEIGSKSKDDIEKYGVKKFVLKCREYATKYIDIMNKEFMNLGVWMDWKNPYLTLEKEYIETIWDTFKKADEKKLLYLGKYPVHVCPRCETSVAYNEIEYRTQEDNSIYVKFPIKDKKNTFLIIWTTTPWTLPGNTGVMVNPSLDYLEIELSNKERWIIAKALVGKLMTKLEVGFTLKDEFKGKKINGLKYENPLSKHLNIKKEHSKNGYRVILSSRYVTIEDGTGLVHCAPGHGKEDYDAGKENNLPIISPVLINGELSEETGKYRGKKARVVDEEIISDLKKEGFLVLEEKFSHDYPQCWRCKSPLLMISLPQWFFSIGKIHSKLLKANKEVKWNPAYMELRMNAWLQGVGDWPISRDRYWGTPLPIWICNKCDNKKIVSSVRELEKISGLKVEDTHKPEIDLIKWKCKCGGEMSRVKEVLDVWFDSGVSSWAALNYSIDKSNFEKLWPADLNLEGKDQIRGWWNSQIILSEIAFGKKPFNSILVHGMVLDLGKKKMSKSLGNIISPQEIINKYGRDYLRYYFAKISKGEDFAFNENEFKDIDKFFRILINVNTFVNQLEKNKKSKIEIEDVWILSKFNNLIKNVTEDYNDFRLPEAIQKLESFLVNDLSRDYIKIIRERSDETYKILSEIRNNFIIMVSPIIPFITESLWQDLKNKKIVKEESIHLASWPKANEKVIDLKLEKEFLDILKIIESGLFERDKAKIGLKWPLSKAIVYGKSKISMDGIKIIKEQLNVKEIKFVVSDENKIELDISTSEELEAEGYARNISRQVQSLRKKLGLIKKDKIELEIFIEKKLFKLVKSQEKFIKERTNANKISFIDRDEKKSGFIEDKFEIKNNPIKIYVKKV